MDPQPDEPQGGYISPGARYEARAYEAGAPEGAREWFVQAVPGQVLADFYGPQADWMARTFADLMNARGLSPS